MAPLVKKIFNWREAFIFYQSLVGLILIMQAFEASTAPTQTSIRGNAETTSPLIKNFTESNMWNPHQNIDGFNISAINSTDLLNVFNASDTRFPQKSQPDILTDALLDKDNKSNYMNERDEHILYNSTQAPKSIDNATDFLRLLQEKFSENVQDHSANREILKLIDLEKYDGHLGNENKDEKVMPHNNGHDGVKVTRKKQLTDKHYKSTTVNYSNAFYQDEILPIQHNDNSAPSPTLRAIEKGFLGPILMEEKTFSVVHYGKNPQKHKSSIESQLREGKLVEIIAPTALLQKQIATPSTDTITTTVVTRETNNSQSQNTASLLSTTVFQVPDTQTSTTHLPSSTTFQTTMVKKIYNHAEPFSEIQQSIAHNQETESRISDIQIEIYESTVEPHLSSTNKENEGYFSSPLDLAVAATKPPIQSYNQERFTQYVIDHTDFSTPESSIAPLSLESGKPEPAAIEIHINVSEGMGSESENLEFSYRQSEFLPISARLQNGNASFYPTEKLNAEPKKNTSESDELLVVEIIDTGENNTENSASFETFNVNPIFTLSSETLNDSQIKKIKLTAEISHFKGHISDDLFIPDVRKEIAKAIPPTPSPAPQKTLIPERDSDTIFYISNTEVKVGESPPTANTNSDQELKKNKLQSQFFPVDYHTSTYPNVVKLEGRQRYEEEIILSPLSNTANALKIVRSQSENNPPLDVTYVGESVIEVEQLPAGSSAAPTSASVTPQSSDVEIQPAVLPEISIGVPIIGELPPQIELKETEYIPNETSDQRLRVYENSDAESLGNEVDKIMESSVQYGGDLIDEGGVIEGGGFDGVEASYPFRNPAEPSLRTKADADFSHIIVNHSVSNLRRNELLADVPSQADISTENAILKEISLKNETDGDSNGTAEASEHNSNATAFSVVEEQNPIADSNLSINDIQTLIFACLATLLPLVVAVLLVFGLRYFYQKYQANPTDADDSTNQLANGKSGDGDDHDEQTINIRPSERHIFPTTGVSFETSVNERSDSSRNPMTPSECGNVFCVKLPSEFGAVNGNAAPITLGSIPSSYSGPNGSVTTMTLKNNHLIVETEERNDISRDARVTKMRYNTADKDGVFVVEVSRGIDSKEIPNDISNSIPCQRLLSIEPAPISSVIIEATKNHEEVQIHQPPLDHNNLKATEDVKAGILQQIEEVDETLLMPNLAIENVDKSNAYTGLSQSDLSSTSSADSNKQYSYGNQELYNVDHSVYSHHLPKFKPPLSAPVEETQDDDHKSENGHKLVQPNTESQSDSYGICSEIQSEQNMLSEQIANKPNKDKSNEIGESSENLENIIAEENKHGGNNSNEVLDPLIIENKKSQCDDFNEHGVEGYESIMSLPDPPSTEEIKELNDFNAMDAHQLDSLPPPSPPPPLLNNGYDTTNAATKQNGDHYHIEFTNQTQKPLEFTEIEEVRKNLPIPLTPPTSPKILHNGTNGIKISTSVAVAIDVNGS